MILTVIAGKYMQEYELFVSTSAQSLRNEKKKVRKNVQHAQGGNNW